MHNDTTVKPQAPVVYSWRGLAYALRAKTAAQRAVMAATAPHFLNVYDLTTAQRAALFKISVPTLNATRGLSRTELEHVRRGWRPLIKPEDRAKAAITAFLNKADAKAYRDLIRAARRAADPACKSDLAERIEAARAQAFERFG